MQHLIFEKKKKQTWKHTSALVILSKVLFSFLWIQNNHLLPILPDLGFLWHKCLHHSHRTEPRRYSSESSLGAEPLMAGLCIFHFCVFSGLDIELGALPVLGNHCTLRFIPSLYFFLYFEIESHQVTQADCKRLSFLSSWGYRSKSLVWPYCF